MKLRMILPIFVLSGAVGCSSDGEVGQENTGGSGNQNGVGGGGNGGSQNGGTSGAGGSQSADGGQCLPATPNAGVCETCLADQCCADYQACENHQYCGSQLDKFRACRANGGGHECCYELSMPNDPQLSGLFDCCYGQQVVCFQECEPGS